MINFAKLKQLFQTDEQESGSRKPENAGYNLQAKKWQTEGCLSGRSLRPKKWQDEQTFLSDVYNRCTQAKKWQTDGCLSGRSMIEMIGVLAIIGVLSVGAIAGYSKAMYKYRLNKTVNQVNHVAQMVKVVFKDDTNSLVNITPEALQKLGVYDTDMPIINYPGGSKPAHALNNKIDIYRADYWGEYSDDYGKWTLYVYLNNIQECVDLLSYDWYSDNLLRLDFMAWNAVIYDRDSNINHLKDLDLIYQGCKGTADSYGGEVTVIFWYDNR